jgi:hypothetical protein
MDRRYPRAVTRGPPGLRTRLSTSQAPCAVGPRACSRVRPGGAVPTYGADREAPSCAPTEGSRARGSRRLGGVGVQMAAREAETTDDQALEDAAVRQDVLDNADTAPVTVVNRSAVFHPEIREGSAPAASAAARDPRRRPITVRSANSFLATAPGAMRNATPTISSTDQRRFSGRTLAGGACDLVPIQ